MRKRVIEVFLAAAAMIFVAACSAITAQEEAATDINAGGETSTGLDRHR